MRTTVENLYKNATYSQSELIALLSFGIILGFLFSFDNWGVDGVRDQALGVANLLLYTIASIFVLFLFTYIQKVVGVLVGVHASHRVSWVYLTISILLCVATGGKLVLFIPPTLYINQREHLSIGRKPFAFSIKDLRLFALLPLLFLIVVSILISELLPLSATVSSAIFWVTFLTVMYSLIPIEFLTNISLLFAKEKAEHKSHALGHAFETKGASLGSVLLYGSKMNWIFAFAFLICSLISQVTTGVLFSLFFAFFCALALTTMFFVKMEL